ncbi:MAG: hypothetical protein ACERKV_12655 [Clostridiaceae bacterium]
MKKSRMMKSLLSIVLSVLLCQFVFIKPVYAKENNENNKKITIKIDYKNKDIKKVSKE